MLTSLRLVNFKNFADETLKLGPFTVIVGANASGKSNIRDAFRFLHGIGRGYTLAEIIGGKVGAGGQLEWEQIRGAPIEIVRFAPMLPFDWSMFSMTLESDFEDQEGSYFIKVGFNQNDPAGFRVDEEHLTQDSEMVYQARWEDGRVNGQLAYEEVTLDWVFGDGSPVLTQISAQGLFSSRNHNSVFLSPPAVTRSQFLLGSTRFFELLPTQMREPSALGANNLGDLGQNLPSVLESICTNSDRKQTLLSWFEELTPMEVADFEFPRDPSGRVHLRIVERNGRKISANSASDGTLRFLAMLALLVNEDAKGTYFFEDIDAGIHPNRLWLLLDLIERQTAKGNIQVITTTHNPALLAWMNDETFEHTSVVYRDQYWSDSVIRPIAGLYNLRELRKSNGLERLFTSGWLETAMKFSEGDADTDHLDDDDEDDWGMDEE